MLRTSSVNLINGIASTIADRMSPSIKTLYHKIHELKDMEKTTWYYISYSDVSTLAEFVEYICNYLDNIAPYMHQRLNSNSRRFSQYRGFIAVFERV